MKCLNCNKELELVAGKKQRQYCDDACRKAFARKSGQNSNPDKSQKQIRTRQMDGVTSPANFGFADCQCMHCRQLKSNSINGKLNHGSYMSASELRDNGYTLNRVSLSGDIDYRGAISNAIRS